MKLLVGRQPSPRRGGAIIIEELSEEEFGALVRGLRAEQAMAFVRGVATNECLFLHEQLSEILRSRAFRSAWAGRDIGGEIMNQVLIEWLNDLADNVNDISLALAPAARLGNMRHLALLEDGTVCFAPTETELRAGE